MKMQKSVVFVKENFENKFLKRKKYLKLEFTVIIQEKKEVLRIAYII